MKFNRGVSVSSKLEKTEKLFTIQVVISTAVFYIKVSIL